MTQVKTVAVSCPKCKADQEMKVWDALNATLNPAEKALLFEGRMNVFVCQTCGHKALLSVPLLYYDMERVFAVYYFPAEYVDDDDFIRNWVTPEAHLRLPQVPQEQVPEFMADPHIVFSMQELLNYVLFRERVADLHRQEQE